MRGVLQPRTWQPLLGRRHRALSSRSTSTSTTSTTSAESIRHRQPAGDATRTTVSTGTTTAAQQQQQQSRQKTVASPTEAAGNGNPELPKFSLDGLGVSRNMKVFLIVVLSIFGTMETWFYCKAIWRWWYGEQGLAVTADEK
ncbi:hypothetical protein IF1G_03635 [Cordyceps javanica]|uniref:Uncharacterized protein n=1 Tax=Cordyceps javanica TaxID=43265 RepID=A0A545W4K2_9HYPO|nr:hypothetical protein IF1G_03635 [Cordyceps javanica]TQW08929.1 hypothetical protein IF2G_03360 [Cordyceps javanica]